jgi:hypothetical protein
MHQVRYYTQSDQPNVMVPDRHHAVDKHGTIRNLYKKVSKKERNRLKKLAGKE